MRAQARLSASVIGLLSLLACGKERSTSPAAPADERVIESPSPSVPSASPALEALAPPPEAKEIEPPATTGFGEKRKSVRAGGPTRATEKAILDGLRWLARHQFPDGSWRALASGDRCSSDPGCVPAGTKPTDHYDAGLTGLALLCFLDAGFSHESKDEIVDPVSGERHRAGEIVKRGLESLRRRQNAEGSFSGERAFMYNDAIATLALARAYGATKNRYWKEPAAKGVVFLQDAQRANPSGAGRWGWRYASRREAEDIARGEPAAAAVLFDADTSSTSWCAMALHGARSSGLPVEAESLEGALTFCEHVTRDNGLVGYLDAKGAGMTVTGTNDHFVYHPSTMAAMGACIRLWSRSDSDDPFLDLAARRIVQDLPAVSKDRLSIDYVYWHFGTRALHELDGSDVPDRTGKYWSPWNKALVAAVLSLQDHAEKTCTNGGWIVGDRWSHAGGPVYSTAINVLTLEIYYRHDTLMSERRKRQLERVRQRLAEPVVVVAGAKAPDLRAVDLGGKAFRLSEFGGRVVLVDFWSAAKRDLIPDVGLRVALAQELAGRPFEALEIVTDPFLSAEYPPEMTDERASWRVAMAGAASTPVLEDFEVKTLPTTILIDAQGVIRARDLPWEEMVGLAEKLVAEAEARAKGVPK